MNDRSRQQGFTLVELVIAMVIIATLAAIAIPSYSSYVLKSHRTEAKGALLDLAASEERYYSTNNQYTTNPSLLGYPATYTTPPFPIGTGGYYSVQTITLTAVTAPSGTSVGSPATFTITANAVGNQLKDTACASFTVSSAGQQTAQNSASVDNTADCWSN
jgi:type IV pilus assembly protein PilE